MSSRLEREVILLLLPPIVVWGSGVVEGRVAVLAGGWGLVGVSSAALPLLPPEEVAFIGGGGAEDISSFSL